MSRLESITAPNHQFGTPLAENQCGCISHFRRAPASHSSTSSPTSTATVMNKFRHPLLLLWAACSALLLALAPLDAVAVDAKPPGKMAFQGFLTDGSGTARGLSAPVNLTVTFRIYAAPNAAAADALWAESQVVTVDKGHFSVVLGEGTAIAGASPDNLAPYFIGDNENGRYLGITVNSENEIAPRIQFLAAPFAQLSRYATELVGTSGSSVLKVGAGTVGINLAPNANPASALEVNGTITATSLNLASGISANTFAGNGAGLTSLNANNLVSGTLPDGRLSGNVARRDVGNTFNGNQRITAGSLLLDNNQLFYGKNNAGIDEAFLWPRAGDNTTYMNYGAGGFAIRNNNSANTAYFRPSGNANFVGNVGIGIGTADPAVPLTFPSVLGDKISMWGGGGDNYGFGVDNSTLQIHTDGSGAAIAFGYGRYGAFNETARITYDALYVRHPYNPQLQLNRTSDGKRLQLYHSGDAVILGLTGSYHYPNNFQYASYNGDSNWDFYSDRRLKKDIVDAQSVLDRVQQVQVRNFRWKDSSSDAKPMIGVIAQELLPLFPDMVTESEHPVSHEKFYMVGYGDFAVIAIKAVQELKKQHDSEIAELKAQMAEIIQANKAMRAELSSRK